MKEEVLVFDMFRFGLFTLEQYSSWGS